MSLYCQKGFQELQQTCKVQAREAGPYHERWSFRPIKFFSEDQLSGSSAFSRKYRRKICRLLFLDKELFFRLLLLSWNLKSGSDVMVISLILHFKFYTLEFLCFFYGFNQIYFDAHLFKYIYVYIFNLRVLIEF